MIIDPDSPQDVQDLVSPTSVQMGRRPKKATYNTEDGHTDGSVYSSCGQDPEQ